jgi:hypothetical protein
MKWLRTAGLLAVVTMIGLSCVDSLSPQPGELKVWLTTANSGADTAIVLRITGPTGALLMNATAGTGLQLFQPPLTSNTATFALIGQLTQGTVILTIRVPDVSAVSQYSGTIEGIAQPNYQLRVLSGGDSLSITR